MNEFNFLPLSGDYRGDLDGNGHMTVQWLGMTVHDAQSKMDLAPGRSQG